MVLNTNHMSFTVGDIDRCIRFFTRNFEFELEGVRYDITAAYLKKVIGYPDGILHIAFLRFPGGRIELVEYKKPKGKMLDTSTKNIGSAHICLDVSDIHVLYERLKKNGITCVSEPVLITKGPNEGAYVVYVKGPDGINIELYQKPIQIANN